MAYGRQDIETLLRLVPQLAAREEINSLLRERKIPFTAANWETFIRDRLRQAIENDKITVAEVARFLAGSEEYGRQHVFLYRIPKRAVSSYLNQQHLSAAARKLAVESVLDEPRVLDQPPASTIVDLRIDKTDEGNVKALVAKVVETRVRREFIDEEEGEAEDAAFTRILTRRYGERRVRAVNVAQLNSDGILEVRIQTHETALDYGREAAQLLLRLKDLLPPRSHGQYPITNAKANLWARRDRLKDRMEVGTSFLRNAAGTAMTVAPGSDQVSLLEDSGAEKGIAAFVKEQGSFEKSDYRVLRNIEEDQRQTRTHILLGALNQYVVIGQCSREDHENALGLIVENNDAVSS